MNVKKSANTPNSILIIKTGRSTLLNEIISTAQYHLTDQLKTVYTIFMSTYFVGTSFFRDILVNIVNVFFLPCAPTGRDV
jgi:hypothetical protein